MELVFTEMLEAMRVILDVLRLKYYLDVQVEMWAKHLEI